MIRDFVDLYYYTRARFSFPKVKVGFGARVYGDSKVGCNSKLEKGTRVYASVIGPDVTVASNTIIRKTMLEHSIKVYNDCLLVAVSVGAYCYIASGSMLGFLTMGRFCSIGPGLKAGLGNHPMDFVSTSPVFFSTQKQCGTTFASQTLIEENLQITIGNDVWIGANAFIRDGVKIGNGAIIAAGAVVINDVPDYAIVGGIPAKILRYRFADTIIASLLKIQWWNWDSKKLQKAQPYIASNDVRSFIEWADRELSV